MTQLIESEPAPVLEGPARSLLAAVEADPVTALRAGIVAPGGYGKTTLLCELRHAYRQAGVTPVCAPPADPRGTAVLVDDAHLLPEPQLRELAALAGSGAAPVIVACRPWPWRTALAELTDMLGRDRSPLLLRPFEARQTARFIASATASGGEPDAAVVAALQADTGGVPGLLARVAGAWQQPGDGRPAVPAGALTAFRPLLDLLAGDVQRFLLAVDAGVGLQLDLLAALLEAGPDTVADVMAAARATGLLGADGRLLPIVQRAVRALVPVERRIAVRQRLAELRLQRGGPVLPVARPLLGAGLAGPGIAAVFHAAAREASDDPALAARCYAEAVAAGRPVAAVAAGWARAAALSGDFDRALRLADPLLTSGNDTDRVTGARVAAAALAHRGQLGRSAALYRWSGAAAAPLAAIGLMATGQQPPTQPQEPVGGETPPTLLHGAVALMAQGVAESVTGSAAAALACLVRAATMLEPAGQQALLPDSPAALAALVGLHGELAVVPPVLERAVAAGLGGPAMAVRHRLLLSWLAMVCGTPARAREQLSAAAGAVTTLHPRDRLFAVALEVGLARRNSDPAALRRVWSQAGDALLRQPVDLFTLAPLGELVVAAARLGDSARLAPHLAEAWSLLGTLNDPPLWSAALHWSCLHAAIIAEVPDAVREHAEALAASAGHCDYCALLAAAAGRWAEIAAGRVDAAAVETAARGLHGAGLWWDGAQLAGQAAIRTADRAAMVSLLNCARLLQGKPARTVRAAGGDLPGAVGQPVPAVGGPAPETTALLSQRERDVAGLLLEGLTYKQIGDRLFISAKTVEHHVARMRRRLGCADRAELLERLRVNAG